MEKLIRNLKFTVRMLWKSPSLTITVLLTLALGIGANTAIFTVGYATVFASVALVLVTSALVACLITAQRAASVQPMRALRSE